MDSVSFKFYASCGYSQGPVNAVLDAVGSKGIKAEDITAIHIHSALLTVLMEGFSHPHYKSDLNPVNINFSTKRSVGAAILSGSLDGNYFAGGNDVQYYEKIKELSKEIFIHYSWKHTIELIMGMDACLKNPGYPGVFDTSTSNRSMKYLRKVYKNRTLFEWKEYKELFKLPPGYLIYLVKRVLRAKAGKYGFSSLRSYEYDLSKLVFKTGATIEIHTVSGEIIKGNCIVPKGFAGDPEKALSVYEKFERECSPVYGQIPTAALLSQIMESGFPLMEMML
jgi:hypothetical protein